VGVVVASAGLVTLLAGLDAADKIGSVVGALCGVLGLGVSVYGLAQARRSPDAQPQPLSPEPAMGSPVTNSMSEATVSGRVVMAGSIGQDVVVGDGNVVGDLVTGPGGVIVAPGGQVTLPTAAAAAEPLPPPKVELCVGRDEPVAQAVASWVAGRPVAVVGGPGIGKSTVLGRAIGDPAVVESYGPRRFVVSCEGAENAGAVVDKLAETLGVPPGAHLRNRVLSFIRMDRCVLVLDNFETVADGDPAGSAALVAQLQAADNPVVLGLGYRGAGLPAGVSGAVEIRLGPLTREAARDVFAAVAGDRHRTDPNLDPLLAGLDGVPLAVVLLATLARSEPRLDTLLTAWQAKRTDLLRHHAARPDRTSSLPVSLELSWDRLSPDARDALSLAAFLPDGWPHGRPGLYLPDELAAGVIEIGSRALLHDDETRQRCLAPIRQHVLTHHPPPPVMRDQLIANVRTLAGQSRQVGGPDGAGTITALTSEFINLVEVIRTRLPHESDLAPAVSDLLEFQRFTGLGDDQLALQALASSSTPSTQAALALALGLLYDRRGRNDRARELFGQALPLFQQVGDVLGEANCLRNLGRVEFLESRNDRARELFGQALPLYQQVGSVLGEANCLRNLGRVEFRESRNDRARELFGQALPLYQQVGDVLGEANCLSNLGEVEFRESRNDRARELFDRAIPLYQQVGDVLGEANCLSNLGEVEFRESRNDRARELFGQALPLYQHVGDVIGEANCLSNLGEVEFRESRNDRARELFGQALPLYQRIRDRYSLANTHAWLARTTNGDQRNEHCAEVKRLTDELGLDWLQDSLRAISGC
jgi:tetratricopeptide (TPR) repeat protein